MGDRIGGGMISRQEISEPVLLRDIIDQDKLSSLDRFGLKIMPKNQLVVFVRDRNEPYPEVPECSPFHSGNPN